MPWMDERRWFSIASLLGGGSGAADSAGAAAGAGGTVRGTVLVTGTGTLMTRRLVVVPDMPNLRKASRICPPIHGLIG